jgi:hypothetical protein
MKRILTALLCCLLLCCAVNAAGNSTAGNSAAIDAYRAEAAAAADGSVKMTVTVQITFPAAVSSVDLPIGGGSDAAVSGYSAKRVSGDGGPCLRVTFPSPVSGKYTFVLTYTLASAFTQSSKGQSLALDLICPGWAWPMTKASFQVTLPAAVTAEPAYTGGYYGDTVEDHLKLTHAGAVLGGTFSDAVKDHDSLRMTLALPAGYFTPQGARGISGGAALTVVLLLLAACAVYWFLTLRSAPVRPSLRPLPPDGSTAGELPTLLTGDRPDLALQAFQWASSGYLGVYYNGRGRIVLRQRIAMGSERRRREQVIFGALFERKPYCDGESLHFRRLADRYADATRAYWNRRAFSRNSGSPALLRAAAALAGGAAAFGAASAALPASRLRILLLLLLGAAGAACGVSLERACADAARRRFPAALLRALPGVAALAFCWASGCRAAGFFAALGQVLAALLTLRGGRRTAAGREHLSQTLGFRRYLLNVSNHQVLLMLRRDAQYFYRVLPYAEAVGLGERFAAAFGEAELEPCDWFAFSGRPPRTAPEFYAAFRSALRRMQGRRETHS